MLTVFGSTALDTIRTPKKTLKNALGGAATYAALIKERHRMQGKKVGIILSGGNAEPDNVKQMLRSPPLTQNFQDNN